MSVICADAVSWWRFQCELLMRLWIDLANSPHVPFFRALIEEFVARGAEIEFTARDFAETIPLARAAGLSPHAIGGYGGGPNSRDTGRVIKQAWATGS